METGKLLRNRWYRTFIWKDMEEDYNKYAIDKFGTHKQVIEYKLAKTREFYLPSQMLSSGF